MHNTNVMGFSYLGSCVSVTFDKKQCRIFIAMHSVIGSGYVIISFYFYLSVCFCHCLILHSISVYFSFFLKINVTGHLHIASTSLTTTDLSFLYNLIKFNLSCLINTNLSFSLKPA